MVAKQIVKWTVAAALLLAFSLSGKAQELPEFNMSDTTITECFGILYDSGGPQASYAQNENTVTVISTGGTLTLTFFGTFALEFGLDSVYFYNGIGTGAPLIGGYTGQTAPSAITATSGSVTVVLVSDDNVAGAGFALEWESVQPPPVPPVISVNTIPACNSTQLNVNFSTPVQCAWLADAIFEVSAAGQNIPITTVQQNCAAGQTSVVTLVMSQPFSFNCNFLVNLTLQIPDACDVIYEFNLGTSFLFQNCGISAELEAASNDVCPGGCTTIEAVVTGCFTYTYAWSNGLPANAGPHQVCPSSATTYSVTITELETGNTAIETITIGIEDVTIVTPSQTICQSAPNLNMQAGTTGVWSGPGIIVGTNQFDPDMAGGGTHTILFETPGCSDTVEITVTPISTQNVTAGCPGSAPFQLSATPTGGTWSGTNTTPDGMFDPIASGIFTVDYTVNGCTDNLTVNVDTIAGPYVLDPICQSIWFETIDFSPYGGIWSGEGITDANQGIFSPSQATPGTVQLTYSINGCDQQFEIFVKEINVNTYEQVCPDEDPMILDNSPAPAGGNWSSPDGAIINTTTGLFDPGLVPNNTFTYINYLAPNGCIDTLFIDVVRTAIGVDELAFCINDPAVVLDSAQTGGLLPQGGVWTGPGVSGNVGAGFTFNPQLAGLGAITLYYDINSCIDSMEVIIFPPGLPDAPQNFCSSDPAEVLAPGLIEGGTWSGSGIVDPITGLFDPAVAQEGTYYVRWTNPGGCNDSILVTVETLEIPVITGLDSTYCMQSMDISFTASPPGGLLVGSLGSYLFNPINLGPGNYQVIYRITPQICPQSADTVDFVIHPPISLAPLTLSDNPVCPDQSVTVTATATGGNPDNTLNYAWSNGAISLPTNTFVPGVSMNVSVTVSDGCSEPVSGMVDIAVYSEFIITALTSDSLCPGEQGFASVAVFPPGNYAVTWNGFFDADNFIEAASGSVYNIEVNDANGCEQDTVVIIPVYPNVVAGFSITPNVDCISFEDMGNVIFTDQSANGFEGTWDFGNGETSLYAPGQSLIQAYPGPGEYTVTLSISNAGGCTDEVSRTLCVQPSEPIFIPDIFSPNGDTRNDTLFVRGLFITKMEFRVYNRWGEQVFLSQDASVGWDGQHRGQPSPSGTYFYTLQATVGNNERLEQTGEIILVR